MMAFRFIGIFFLYLVLFFSNLYSIKLDRPVLIPVAGTVLISQDNINYNLIKNHKFWKNKIYLKTSSNSFLRIKYHNHSEIKINQNSFVCLDKNSVNIYKGNVLIDIKKNKNDNFMVKTPFTVSKVNFAEFETEVYENKCIIYSYFNPVYIRSKNYSRREVLYPGKKVEFNREIYTMRQTVFNFLNRKKIIWSDILWNKMEYSYKSALKKNVLSQGEISTVSSLVDSDTEDLVYKNKFKKWDKDNKKTRVNESVDRFNDTGLIKRSPWILKKLAESYSSSGNPENKFFKKKYELNFENKSNIIKYSDKNTVRKNELQLNNYKNTINRYWTSNNINVNNKNDKVINR